MTEVPTEDFADDLPAQLDEDEPRPCLRFDDLAADHGLRWKKPAWGWLEAEWRGHPRGLLVVRDGQQVYLFSRYRRDDPDLFAIS